MRGWRGDDIDCKGSEGELRGGLAKFKLTVHSTPGSSGRHTVHRQLWPESAKVSKIQPFQKMAKVKQRFVKMS